MQFRVSAESVDSVAFVDNVLACSPVSVHTAESVNCVAVVANVLACSPVSVQSV